jgi:hypothetical protein
LPDDSKKLKSGVSLRSYREGDEERLNELFELVFGARRPLAGWYWKFRDNPVLDRILISLAVTEDGTIAGMYPLLVMEYKVGDRLALAVQSVEISIHPDLRGRWIVWHLKEYIQAECVRSGVKFGFGFPTRPHAKVGVRYMNYRMLGELPILGKRIHAAPPVSIPRLDPVLRRVAAWAGHLRSLVRFAFWAGAERSGGSAPEIVEVDRFDEEYDRLWDRISGEHTVIAHRSSRYLNWRYVENPMARFIRLAARRDGELAGYLVCTALDEEDGRNGIIFDFFCGKNDPVARPLLRAGLLRLLRERVRTIRCGALPHMPVHDHLVSLGFRKWPSSPVINFEILDGSDDGEIMERLEAWYLGIGDTDLLGW